jgi:hypothetical protein
VTANDKAKKLTSEEFFSRAKDAIERSRQDLKEFRRQQRAFDNSRAKEEAGCMFPKESKGATEDGDNLPRRDVSSVFA